MNALNRGIVTNVNPTTALLIALMAMMLMVGFIGPAFAPGQGRGVTDGDDVQDDLCAIVDSPIPEAIKDRICSAEPPENFP